MKILIGGLLPKQRRVVEQKVPRSVKLTFAGADKEPQQWREAARHCDACILVTKFVSHKHEEALQAAGARPIRHSGGIGRLIDLVKELACASTN